MADNPTEIPQFIRRRCPGATDDELRQAYERFQAYLALAYRIFERCQETEPDSPMSPSSDRVENIGSS